MGGVSRLWTPQVGACPCSPPHSPRPACFPPVKVAVCLTLCNPMDYSLPGSSVHGVLQARILEWLAVPFSKGSSQPRDQTLVSCTAGRFFTI